MKSCLTYSTAVESDPEVESRMFLQNLMIKLVAKTGKQFVRSEIQYSAE